MATLASIDTNVIYRHATDAMHVSGRRQDACHGVRRTTRRLFTIGALLSTFTLVACERPLRWDSAVVIVVDTLRADHLGVYGYGRQTSPNIDRWSDQAVVFETALATSPWTLPTFGTLLTGELPSQHLAGSYETVDGKREYSAVAGDVPTLAEMLAEHDVSTGAVMNNPFLHPRFGISRGFETYDYVTGNNVKLRRADAVVDAALRWLDDHAEQPFLLVVHMFDPYLNYDPPPPFRGRFTGNPQAEGYRDVPPGATRRRLRRGELVDFEFLEAAYDEEIAFVDSEVGRLLDALQSRGISKRTLVLLTADHGEEFFDHGGFEHGHTMYQELLRVPLLAWGPGIVPRRILEAVSLLDVAPTILEGLGVELLTSLPGVSLLGVLRGQTPPTGRTLVAEVPMYGPERSALIQWPLKLIRAPGDGEVLLFDLRADADELTNLANERPHEVSELARTLRELQRASAAPGDFATVDLDPETIRQLRALGYVQ